MCYSLRRAERLNLLERQVQMHHILGTQISLSSHLAIESFSTPSSKCCSVVLPPADAVPFDFPFSFFILELSSLSSNRGGRSR